MRLIYVFVLLECTANQFGGDTSWWMATNTSTPRPSRAMAEAVRLSADFYHSRSSSNGAPQLRKYSRSCPTPISYNIARTSIDSSIGKCEGSRISTGFLTGKYLGFSMYVLLYGVSPSRFGSSYTNSRREAGVLFRHKPTQAWYIFSRGNML